MPPPQMSIRRGMITRLRDWLMSFKNRAALKERSGDEQNEYQGVNSRKVLSFRSAKLGLLKS